MKWFDPYKDELSLVFQAAEDRIRLFPEPLSEQGIHYLNGFNPLRRQSVNNYVCYLLPYWMQELVPLPTEQCRGIATGNVLLMLYFFIQDDLMDGEQHRWKEQLALANLLYAAFLEHQLQLFPSQSSYWQYFSTYIREWAAAVSRSPKGDFRSQPELLWGKSAPVKLGSTGALLLAGREDAIPQAASVVEQLLVTLQMADDWADWRDDVQTGSDNSLLSLIPPAFPEMADDGHGKLTEARAAQAIFTHHIMKSYAEHAIRNNERIQQLNWIAPSLESFHQALVDDLVQAANHIEKSRDMLKMGGLDYYLSKINK
ncbi:hypothetical protein EBB07_04350 [Paenibacillaceae bacterium]|nr:hypothetical protein EBB07_04350 [Paenibacillaceae bacterium]